MDQFANIQRTLFEKIKERISPNLTLVHEVSEILGQSYDSAYRRIRGDQFLTFDELLQLSSHYRISVDALCSNDHKNVSFESFIMDPEKFRIKDWMTNVKNDMKVIKESSEKKIIYAAKDPPIYHYFIFPEIIAFKTFVWEKTVFQFPEYKEKKFSFESVDSEILSIGKQISKLATLVPTLELWNEDTLLLVLRQIEYYWVAGLFETKEDVRNLLDKTEKWFIHLRKQAELGFKFLVGEPEDGIENSYVLYETEVIHLDNAIYVDLGERKFTYLAINSLNLMRTTNALYCENMKNFLDGIVLSSNLISHSGEKERNRLFNKTLYLIEELRKRIN